MGLALRHKDELTVLKSLDDLLCWVKRRWVRTTDSRDLFPKHPDLIKRVAITRLSQVWLSDITHIHIRTSFVYLGAILDGFFRKVIGLCRLHEVWMPP